MPLRLGTYMCVGGRGSTAAHGMEFYSHALQRHEVTQRRHGGLGRLKLIVGSGIECSVLNPVRPIRAVHLGNSTD